jgi:DNA excision repair protein ERCC-2
MQRRARAERRRPVGFLDRAARLGRRAGRASGGPSWARAGTASSGRRRWPTARTPTSRCRSKGAIARGGWIVALSGRIDQVVRTGGADRAARDQDGDPPLPADEAELRADYPGYFVQLAAYAARGAPREGPPASWSLWRRTPGWRRRCASAGGRASCSTGSSTGSPSSSTCACGRGSACARCASGRRSRRRAPARRRWEPELTGGRPGRPVRGPPRGADRLRQDRGPARCALGELRAGLRAGALPHRQVDRPAAGGGDAALDDGSRRGPRGAGAPVAAWHVRNKAEHCVNAVFQCVREACAYLDGAEERWPASGLSRFYLIEDQPSDLAALRSAGIGARICPYEITRAALAFNDVWIGDYNYVFSPDSRGLFYERPGFEPARTLLVVDEAHNLPSRAADAHSHASRGGRRPRRLRGAAQGARPRRWVVPVGGLGPLPGVPPQGGRAPPDAEREDARDAIRGWPRAQGSSRWTTRSSAPTSSGPHLGLPSAAEAAIVDRAPAPLVEPARRPPLGHLPRRRAGHRRGAARVRRASSWPPPRPAPPSASPRLRLGALAAVRAATPWRDGAYDVAVDLRVDTTFQHRQRHVRRRPRPSRPSTAPPGPGAPSPSSSRATPTPRRWPASRRAALQPRRSELSAQAPGSTGRSTGPGALPRARLGLRRGDRPARRPGLARHGGRPRAARGQPGAAGAPRGELAGLGRDAAFDRVYRIPGMQKVNQALGRLVRAPGQRARVLLHCRRFAEPGYERLLAPEYRSGGGSSRTTSSPRGFLPADEPYFALPGLRGMQYLAGGPPKTIGSREVHAAIERLAPPLRPGTGTRGPPGPRHRQRGHPARAQALREARDQAGRRPRHLLPPGRPRAPPDPEGVHADAPARRRQRGHRPPGRRRPLHGAHRQGRPGRALRPRRPATVELAVLVDRGSRRLPVAADFVGHHPVAAGEDEDVLVSPRREPLARQDRDPAAAGPRRPSPDDLEPPTPAHDRGTQPRRDRADPRHRRGVQEDPPAQREEGARPARQDDRQPLPRAEHAHAHGLRHGREAPERRRDLVRRGELLDPEGRDPARHRPRTSRR